MRNLHGNNVSISRNTISRGSGSGIKLFNVKASLKSMMPGQGVRSEFEAADTLDRCAGLPERVDLIDNYIVETVDGYGMVLDTTTCKLD